MINQFRKRHRLIRPEQQYNDYGELVEVDSSTERLLYITIVLSTTIATHNPLFETVKYVGSYFGQPQEFRKGDRIDNEYEITDVVYAGRLTYLLLEELDNGEE